jgi:hypothetical protein
VLELGLARAASEKWQQRHAELVPQPRPRRHRVR